MSADCLRGTSRLPLPLPRRSINQCLQVAAPRPHIYWYNISCPFDEDFICFWVQIKTCSPQTRRDLIFCNLPTNKDSSSINTDTQQSSSSIPWPVNCWANGGDLRLAGRLMVLLGDRLAGPGLCSPLSHKPSLIKSGEVRRERGMGERWKEEEGEDSESLWQHLQMVP